MMLGDMYTGGGGAGEDGKGANARFNCPCGMTVDAAGHIVVVDAGNLRRVSKAGEVSTLAGNGKEGFPDGQGDAARFYCPFDVALAANDEIVVAYTENHSIRRWRSHTPVPSGCIGQGRDSKPSGGWVKPRGKKS